MTMTHRNERGAVAVITALLAVVIIAVAAFAVDIGNAYARQRVVQSQADLAALAGGAMLDGTSPSGPVAIAEAIDYVEKNEVFGGGFDTSALTDGNSANGEVTVNGNFTEIRVVAPPATVNYGLARVIGESSQDVQAEAVAGIFSPDGVLAPFFLAEGCVIEGGSTIPVKTAPSGTSLDPTPISPAYFPSPTSPSPSWPEVGSITPFAVEANVSGQEIVITGQNFDSVIEVGFVWSEDPAENVTETDSVVVTLGVKKNDADSIQVTVPDEALEITPAPFDQERLVYVQVRSAGADWSAPSTGGAFSVPLPGVPSPAGCNVKNQGDFGYLESPRADGTVNQEAYKRNIALGLDHGIAVYPGGAPALVAQGIPPAEDAAGKWDNTCVKYTATPPFYRDLIENRDVPPNCLNIYPGDATQLANQGFVTGDDEYQGRLDEPASEACGAAAVRTITIQDTGGPESFTINNDRLSCFLKDGVRFVDVFSPGALDIVDGSILSSPRFMLVPVVHATAIPSNSEPAVIDYLAGMITAEQPTSTKDSPKPLPDNGVILANKSLGVIELTYFDTDALPEFVDSPGGVIPYLGAGPKVLLLVE